MQVVFWERLSPVLKLRKNLHGIVAKTLSPFYYDTVEWG